MLPRGHLLPYEMGFLHERLKMLRYIVDDIRMAQGIRDFSTDKKSVDTGTERMTYLATNSRYYLRQLYYDKPRTYY